MTCPRCEVEFGPVYFNRCDDCERELCDECMVDDKICVDCYWQGVTA